MNFINKLREDFPDMFGNCFECCVGPGWQDIIYSLTKKIDKKFKGKVEVLQIKEKFASLRYYFSIEGDSQEVWKLVKNAIDLCDKTCEACGSKDNVKSSVSLNSSWLKTLCKECRNKRDEDQNFGSIFGRPR